MQLFSSYNQCNAASPCCVDVPLWTSSPNVFPCSLQAFNMLCFWLLECSRLNLPPNALLTATPSSKNNLGLGLDFGSKALHLVYRKGARIGATSLCIAYILGDCPLAKGPRRSQCLHHHWSPSEVSFLLLQRPSKIRATWGDPPVSVDGDPKERMVEVSCRRCASDFTD